MSRISPRQIIFLIFCIFIPLIIGVIGSFFTVSSISEWYVTLVKPWFNPPNWVFGPAWTILYILMGISLWMVIKDGISSDNVRKGVIIFGAQLLVNLLWSIVFFGMRSPLGAFVTILILLGLIVLTIRSFRIVSPQASYLLYPYFCWTMFATLLNAMIVVLN
jgi:tryptophan-rich sensory protein